MTPSSSANDMAQVAQYVRASPRRVPPVRLQDCQPREGHRPLMSSSLLTSQPRLYGCADCPVSGPCNFCLGDGRHGAESALSDEAPMDPNGPRPGSPDEGEVGQIEARPIVFSPSLTEYGTPREAQAEFSGVRDFMGSPGTNAGSPSKARPIARVVGKAKGFVRMLTLRKSGRKVRSTPPLPPPFVPCSCLSP